MYQLSEVLSSCEPDGLLPTRLTELSLRACSLLFSQLPSNLPVLVDFHFTGIGKTDLIPADYAGSKSALLVSCSDLFGEVAALQCCQSMQLDRQSSRLLAYNQCVDVLQSNHR